MSTALPTRYKQRRIAGRRVAAHVLIAEQALGKRLPPGAQVHHVNEDRRDNRNTNLVICQNNAYHQLLHARTRIARAGGNPNFDKICSRCREVKPKTLFCWKRSRGGDRRHNACQLCATIEQRERLQQGAQ